MKISERDKEYIKEMQEGMSLGVFGRRVLNNRKVWKVIEKEIEKYDIKEIVTAGEIGGVTEIARKVAKQKGIGLKLYFPDRERFARGCYAHRGLMIATTSDRILIVWDGESKGTHNEIELCNKLGIKYELAKIDAIEDSMIDSLENIDNEWIKEL